VTGVLRLALGYFVLNRLQRVLCVVGALLAAADVALTTTGILPGPGSLLLLGLMLAGMPPLPFTGIVFRDLSATRVNNLVPHFRLRMLASVLAFVGVLVLASWLVVSAFPPGPGGPPPGAIRVVFPFALASAVVLSVFIGRASPRAAAGVGVLWLATWAWIQSGAAAQLAESGVEPTLAIAAITGAAWTLFASWYLTTPHVAARTTGPPEGRGLPTDWTARITPRAAVATYLSGWLWVLNVRRDARQAVVVLPLAFGFLWLVGGMLPGSVPWKVMAPAMIGGLQLLGVQAAQLARRARLLWLTGRTRADLFRACEQRALTFQAFILILFGAILATWLPQISRDPLSVSGVAVMTVVMVSLASFSTYLGLMFVEGWRTLDVVLVGVLLASHLAFCGSFGLDDSGTVMVAIVAVQLTGALVCRAVARRRWERIDWTRLKPIRWLTPRVAAPR
jgi:hypothetical protein